MGAVDHIGIASESIDSAVDFWRILGFMPSQAHVNEEQGVRIKMLESPGSSTRIELLEPLGPDTPVGRFISTKGVGIQQLAIRVDDIEGSIARLVESGVRMIDELPSNGTEGSRIAFIHPSSTGGVLVELVERAD